MTTITIDRAVVEQALKGLERWREGGDPRCADDYITALRAALAQEQAEPVGVAGLLVEKRKDISMLNWLWIQTLPDPDNTGDWLARWRWDR